MQSEEQRLIDGLFSRLREAEAQSAPRDVGADELITQHVRAQPAAPYYMAQTLLIQEAAIKQLNERIASLEQQLTQVKAAKPASGSFLAGLFGGGQPSAADAIPGADRYARQYAGPQPGYAQAAQNYAPGRGGGFMAGALQTAAGVAGGVVLGNMLMNMFGSAHPQEIVNIIEESPAASPALPADDSQPPVADAGYADDPFSGNDDFSNGDDFNDDSFNNDDDWL